MTTLLIRGGTVVNADRATKADVLCIDGLIAAVGPNLQVPAGTTIVDAGGQYVLQLPCLPGEAECGPDGSNVVRSDDGVHFCPGPNLKPCPVYSSGALRFAMAISNAANNPAEFD